MQFFKPTALFFCLALVCACNRESKDIANLKKVPVISLKEEDENKFFSPQQNTAGTTKSVDRQIQRQQTGKSIPNGDWDKKIIKTASIDLEIKNYKSYTDGIRDNVKKFGGYIAQEEQNQTNYKIENTVVIKVPVDRFDNLVAEVTTTLKK